MLDDVRLSAACGRDAAMRIFEEEARMRFGLEIL